MLKDIKERLAQLRQAMTQQNIAAYVIPTADPHLSEYIAPHWQMREWLSGFTGSAGTLIVGEKWAGLWTDSRYYLQAAQQLKGTGITLYRQGEEQTPTPAEEIALQMEDGGDVGTDGRLFSYNQLDELQADLEENGITVETNIKMDTLWTNRPKMPNAPIFLHELPFAGVDTATKLKFVRKECMELNDADYYLVTALDEIAYLLNLRAGDVAYNPVFYAYLLIGRKEATLYIDSNDKDGRHVKDNPEIKAYLTQNKIKTKPYEEIYEALDRITGEDTEATFLLDLNHTNYTLCNGINGDNMIDTESPLAHMKAIKTPTQLQNLREAQINDGIALTQAFCWLDQQIAAGKKVTEISFADHLDHCRSLLPHYFGLSFNTIAGYGAHGAIVHYAATPESDVELKKGNLLLVDSGGNYLNGTTDITRTVSIGGKATPEQQHDYTLVLKGHIALATAKFPAGTCGQQLDILAHQPLWKEGKNYGHGTGHGIGYFLCVHEGPQRISAAGNQEPLEPGMLISDEPGLYLEGRYGIRIENMVCVKSWKETELGRFNELEMMSHFPFDANVIETQLLTPAEVAWIDQYHQQTFDLLSQTQQLTPEETQWLKNKTKKLEIE